jgi:phosphoribosyl 1,2-cyclic phosphate phosphodiesterase
LRVTLLGSAAAEGVPALFCDCDTCREARRRGGRDLRRRTAYLWDDTLVDLGPDLLGQSLAFGLDLSRLRHLLITHTHEDHFLPASLAYRRPGYSMVPPAAELTVYGNATVQRRLEALDWPLADLRLAVCVLRPGEEVRLDGQRSALALRAAHNPAEECLFYLLRAPEGAILIANDSAWWPEDTWQRLGEERLDVAIIDCTYGLSDNLGGHLPAAEVVRAAAELRRLGILSPTGRVIANHFSHNGRCLQADLEARLGSEGVEVGYDGMVVEV